MTAGGAEGVGVDPDALRRGAQALEVASPRIRDAARDAGGTTADASTGAGHPALAAALVEVARRCDTGLASLADRLEVAGFLLRSGADAHERDDDEGALLFRGPPPAPR